MEWAPRFCGGTETHHVDAARLHHLRDRSGGFDRVDERAAALRDEQRARAQINAKLEGSEARLETTAAKLEAEAEARAALDVELATFRAQLFAKREKLVQTASSLQKLGSSASDFRTASSLQRRVFVLISSFQFELVALLKTRVFL